MLWVLVQSATMKLKELQSHLEGLQGFDSPKPQLEQYVCVGITALSTPANSRSS